ncbi:MAG: putative two-component sensor histidine kinase protein, partial [Pedosphaera sp.]|nr:putative two-component sensor histidine kinase protein [Pedosphaera sp.]
MTETQRTIFSPDSRTGQTLPVAEDLSLAKQKSPIPGQEFSVEELYLHLTAIVDSSDDAILSKDLNGIIRSWNKGAERMFGYTFAEVIGQSATMLTPAGRKKEEPDILARVRKGERIEHYETVWMRKDGMLLDISLAVSPIKDASGKIIGASKIARDISDRRRAQGLQSHFRAIVESSDDAILSKDLNGIIRSWNQGAERIFGYQASEVIGRPVTILMPLGRQNEEPEILARIRRGERIDHYETIRQRKDGALVNISLTVSPIKDDSGIIIGASKIARDVTGRKQAEAALQKAREELAALNETLEQRVSERTASLNAALAQMQEFSYSVSHDLRGPVRAMQGYAQAILEDHAGSLSPEVTEYLRRIYRGSSRMDKLTHDVLVYSRLAQNQIKCETLALEVLIRDIILHYPEMQPPHAQISIISPLLNVQAHESLLTQAISNLLNNAKKFVREGAVPKIDIWTERRDSRVRLWIKDNGIGIKPEHHARLFGMFESIHYDDAYEGTG